MEYFFPPELPSPKSYILRGLYEWCCETGLTPHVVVAVDNRTVVPREFVRDGQIVLNISPDATHGLQIGNEYLEFSARFGGVARELSIPVGNVLALYARENGAGMAFDVDLKEGDEPVEGEGLAPVREFPVGNAGHLHPVADTGEAAFSRGDDEDPDGNPPAAGGGSRPRLTRVK